MSMRRPIKQLNYTHCNVQKNVSNNYNFYFNLYFSLVAKILNVLMPYQVG